MIARYALLVATALCDFSLRTLAADAPTTRPAAKPAAGEAARDVVFSEDFEHFDKTRWHEITDAPGAVEIVDGGRGGAGKCVQITATLEKDTGGHLYRMLEPGLDTCYLRFYVKFEKGDIKWRTDPKLKVNGVWMLYYITDLASTQNNVKEPRKVNRIWFDDIVVSKSYIGPAEKK